MERLLLSDGGAWRAPQDDELVRLTQGPSEDETARAYLFSVPEHMRTRFWEMLNKEVALGTGDFVKFSDDLARFLAFKELPPPKASESVPRLLHGLQSFRSMSRMDASFKNARALRLRFSQSLARRRQRLSQAIVRSTIQRLGSCTNPLACADRLTISVSTQGRILASALPKIGP
jgi:hypothetical protein